jgi:predicted DCC family thiol-disulfide oxidoreductase YuxK
MDRVTVFYDADCGFCRWSAAWIARWDRARRLYFAPIQGAEAQTRLAGIDAVRRDGSWHLISRDEHIVSAGAAVAPLLRELPGGRAPAWVASAFPRTTDRAYRAVARRRGSLGRLLRVDACAVPAER